MTENKEFKELNLEQLDAVAGGNLPDDARVATLTALQTITASNGPGEVGEIGYHGPYVFVTVFPAGAQIKVFIDYQINGYVYTNSKIQPLGGEGFQFCYVNLADVSVN